MITGIHAIMYAKNAGATRKFFKDILKWRSVDAGGGWLIFALPPAEVAAHPLFKGREHHELYFMCDDLPKTMDTLTKKGVEFVGKVSNQSWGSIVMFKVPGAGKAGLYQPKHPMAIRLKP